MTVHVHNFHIGRYRPKGPKPVQGQAGPPLFSPGTSGDGGAQRLPRPDRNRRGEDGTAFGTLLAISGFRYQGGDRRITIKAAVGHRCFWSTATAWGTFHVTAAGVTLHVDHGTLECRTLTVNGKRHTPNATVKEGEDLRV